MKSKTLKKILIGSLTVQLISFNSCITSFADEDIGEQIGFAQCEEYINIRSEANIESTIVGKIYNNCAVTILDEQEGWYKIHSGNVEGYVSSEFFVTGAAADSIAEETAYNVATVYPEVLMIRSAPDENAEQIGAIHATDEVEVINYDGDWMLIYVDGMYGYISAYYVDYSTYYPVAETLEEEQYRLDKEWEAYLNQQNYEETLAAESTYEESYDYDYSLEEDYDYDYSLEDDYNYNYDSNLEEDYEEELEDFYDSYYEESNVEAGYVYDEEFGDYVYKVDGDPEDIYYDVGDPTGESLANYARQFVGNSYVWGGTSLTDGADCSGFTQSVMANNGIYIPRTAAEQASCGTQIDLSNIQPGDLLFYDNGGNGVDHVSMYIGDGQVVHASNSNDGIIISDYNYRTPVSASRYW